MELGKITGSGASLPRA